jgi:hypothetical protein
MLGARQDLLAQLKAVSSNAALILCGEPFVLTRSEAAPSPPIQLNYPERLPLNELPTTTSVKTTVALPSHDSNTSNSIKQSRKATTESHNNCYTRQNALNCYHHTIPILSNPSSPQQTVFFSFKFKKKHK